MKSRYKKHLKKVVSKSPIIAFSKEDIFNKNGILNKDELYHFNEQMGLDDTQTISNKYKIIKEEMYSNLILFTDNYLVCGGHNYIYLLLPMNNGKYKIIEKETITEWSKFYWKKEDPNNERDWCFMGEDVNDLFYYIFMKFDKHVKKWK